jgi:hypothetical protein
METEKDKNLQSLGVLARRTSDGLLGRIYTEKQHTRICTCMRSQNTICHKKGRFVYFDSPGKEHLSYRNLEEETQHLKKTFIYSIMAIAIGTPNRP